MTITDLLSTTAVSVASVAAIAWLLRTWIGAKLTADISHRLNQELESQKSEHRQYEELVRSQFAERGAQIAALQASSLAGLNGRQRQRVVRQFWAVEVLWSAVVHQGPMKTASSMLQSINYAAAAEEAPKNANVRLMFQTLAPLTALKEGGPTSSDIGKARLHVSPLTWSLCQAHGTVIMYAAFKVKLRAEGYDGKLYWKEDEMVKLVKAVLPHQSSFIDQYGLLSLDFLVDELEDAVFNALRRELAGDEEDAGAVTRAAAIMHLVNNATPSQTKPTVGKQ